MPIYLDDDETDDIEYTELDEADFKRKLDTEDELLKKRLV